MKYQTGQFVSIRRYVIGAVFLVTSLLCLSARPARAENEVIPPPVETDASEPLPSSSSDSGELPKDSSDDSLTPALPARKIDPGLVRSVDQPEPSASTAVTDSALLSEPSGSEQSPPAETMTELPHTGTMSSDLSLLGWLLAGAALPVLGRRFRDQTS